MELKLSIGFQQLLQLIEQLPANKRKKIGEVIARKEQPASGQDDLRELLMNGPTFTKAQLKRMAEAREYLNRWRDK